MSRPLKMILLSLGVLFGAIALLTVAASAAGVHLLNQSPVAAGQTTVTPSPSPATKQRQANASAKVVRQATTQAESEVLGVQASDLTASLKQGSTVHQLADQKNISQADFQSRFNQALKTILDQDVQQGTLTSQQEQKALKRLGSSVPNWDQAGKPK